MFAGRLLLTAAVALGLSGMAQARPAGPVQVWMTTPDQRLLLARQEDLIPDPAPDTSQAPGADVVVVTLDETRRFQTMTGFGAALTDASAELIHGLDKTRRRALLQELFGAEALHLSFLRLTIGASDFSSRHYTYDDMPPGQKDEGLRHFSIAPAREHVLPLVRAIRRINPQTTLMASPWSAPGWMKTSDRLIGGKLSPDAYAPYARYLARYVEEMGRHGAPIRLITLQNEPGFEPKDYPGMGVSAESRAAFIGGFLGPEFQRRRLATGILDYDHNWDQPASPLTVLADPKARAFVQGVAWHCYNGEVAAQGPVHDAWPDKDAWFSECSGGDWAPAWDDAFGFMTGQLMIGSTRGWARGVLLWNLALDPHHGPHLGGCGDCRGVVTIDPATGRVTRNAEYYALGHLSRFVRPGAVRIAADTVGGLETVAFRNADDASLVLLVRNPGKTAMQGRFVLGDRRWSLNLDPGAVATLRWK